MESPGLARSKAIKWFDLGRHRIEIGADVDLMVFCSTKFIDKMNCFACQADTGDTWMQDTETYKI